MSTLERKNRIAPSLPHGKALAVVALLCATLASVPLRAQDQGVAEAARQARERKAAQQDAAHHVYTDEDLKRNKVLTPEDENRTISRTAPQSTPEKQNTEPQVADENQNAPSLGEVARRYHQEKAVRQAEQAAKSTAPSRFPLDVPANTLAVPKPEVMPGNGSLREDELKLAPAQRNVLPMPSPRTSAPAARNVSPVPRNNFPSRISPFAPREAVVPRDSRRSAPLAVMANSLMRQRVQPGDSWWKLANRYLGKGSRWEELLRVNPGLSHDPGRLPAGTYVFVPGNARAKTSAPPASMVVQKGDTLWSLAREHLGRGSLWPQLASANPEIAEFTKLQVGAKLRLPENAKPTGATRHGSVTP
jgi:nucleoid-associated protein YgaU